VSKQRQEFSKFPIIKKFTVVNDRDVPRFVPEGLMAPGKIYDAEPAHAQGQPRSTRLCCQESFVVGTAVPQCRCHSAHAQLGILASRCKRDTANAAHATV
jgi:hypothetical protein